MDLYPRSQFLQRRLNFFHVFGLLVLERRCSDINIIIQNIVCELPEQDFSNVVFQCR